MPWFFIIDVWNSEEHLSKTDTESLLVQKEKNLDHDFSAPT